MDAVDRQDLQNKFLKASFIPPSRIHFLRQQEFEGAVLFAMREDETGFGISGFKMRKYGSLLPHLIYENFQQAILIGSENSGNVAGLSQLLIQYGIKPLPWLKKSRGSEEGVYHFLTALVNGEENIRYLDAEEWNGAAEMANLYAEDCNAKGIKTFVIPEGANCKQAFYGSLSLWDSILFFETQCDIRFDHVFIDSGTGLTAAALAVRMTQENRNAALHVVLLAGDENGFYELLGKSMDWYTEILDPHEVHERGIQIDLHFPATAKSFGSVNQAVLNEVKRMAREEGILTDPVYSAKLFLEARRIIREKELKGNILLIHSGGAPGLLGFRKEF